MIEIHIKIKERNAIEIWYIYWFKVKFICWYLWKKCTRKEEKKREQKRRDEMRWEKKWSVVALWLTSSVRLVKVFQAMDECDSSHEQIHMIPECTRPTIRIYSCTQQECHKIWKTFKWNSKRRRLTSSVHGSWMKVKQLHFIFF